MNSTRFIVYFLSVLFFTSIPDSGHGADFSQTLSEALLTLEVQQGDRNLLVLTNAPYVKVDGTFALEYLEAVEQGTGCSVGRGNLLFFLRGQEHPLRFLLMRRIDGEAVVLSRGEENWLLEKLNLSPDRLASAVFWEEAKSYVAGGDMGAMAAIAGVWAKGGPYDFLKSAELHNHICPGLISGYLLAHYIKRQLPLAEGEKYTIIASPVWCKEDALQIILDVTPGKRNMIVQPLSQEQQAAITFADPAGMVLIWNEKTKSGTGYALTFDFGKLRELAPPDSPKGGLVLAALDSLAHPERYVTVAAKFPLDDSLYSKLNEGTDNPYRLAGLVK